MGLRRGLGLSAVAALGGAVAMLPTVASSETAPTIEAENLGSGFYEHRWKPSEATVGEGATVPISNPTEVKHGVHWISPPEEPKCEHVPVGEGLEHSGTKWTGACTFAKPGTYTFWCSVHGATMSATVTVLPAGTTTGTTGATGATGATAPPGGGTTSYPTNSPLPAQLTLRSSAVHIRSSQRGRAVRGSVSVPSAAAGGRLEVLVLLRHAAPSRTRPAPSRVGRFARSAVAAGIVRFAVPLSAGGRRVLARAGRIALRIEVRLAPRIGAAAVVRREVLLRG